MIVLDASVAVAALSPGDADGPWAAMLMRGQDIAAPHHMPAEAANILRRLTDRKLLSSDRASAAHHQLLRIPVEYFAYEPFAERVWKLRDSVTPHDAWYVAVAEALQAPLVTLDRRLSRASGPRCDFLTPS